MQLKELKAELAALRVAKVTGGAPNKLSKMYVVSLFALQGVEFVSVIVFAAMLFPCCFRGIFSFEV
jgi:hypothetical protein